ncbi:ABC transporter permease [Flavonifractor plautii]|uniref:ABC transporter permease n=1 Tax=Flavonifractor plautii TaxID=292800 RepID=UPI001CD34AB6|nr:ABC transporter permease [Flavonifractor plautii]UBS59882.1 ABC transporter permease [Flavonifractor plautii]
MNRTLVDNQVKKFISKNSIWLILIVIVAIVTIIKPVFLTPGNLQTLITTESIKGILAFGIMFAILSKGIDLTPGATVAFVSVICASLAQTADASRKILGFGPLPGWLIFLIGIVIGAVIGLIIGAIIAYTKIPPFIATLGGQLILRAASKMYSSIPVSSLSDDFRFFGKGDILGIPMIVIIFVIMFIVSGILLTKTRFGRNVFAIGGNDNAARVAGINVEKNLMLVYMWCSICAAIAGVLLAGRTGSADPSTYGLNYELDAIAAATVGGTSHTGGVCRISGVLAGILILGVINNALILMGVDDNMTNIIKGLIIVGAVILDMRKNAKKV